MEKITGVVTAVSKKDRQTRFGVKPVYSFQLDNTEWFNNGFKDPKVSKDDTVEVVYEVGQYGNDVKAVSVKYGDAEPATTKPQETKVESTAGSNMDTQVIIVRQNSVGNAREMVAALPANQRPKTIEESVQLTLKTAYILENYCLGKLSIQDIMETETEEQPKKRRKRRTKAEIEAEKEQEESTQSDDKDDDIFSGID